MSSEHASDVEPEAVDEDAAAVLFTVFGFDVVLERAFVSFPWRAGLKRGVVAVLVSYVLVSMVGLRGVVVPDRYLALVVGFGYPAVFATVGALLVYVQQEVLASDAGDGTDAGGA
ncbi:MAG: hypothetical protein V5A44_06015 [Haloarculaceae archaeon]